MTAYTAIRVGNNLPYENNVNTNTQMITNQGYSLIANVNMTLPTSATVGDRIEILSTIGAGFTILQNNAPLNVIIGPGGQSTPGAGGSAVANTVATALALICVVQDTTWQILSDEIAVTLN